MSYQPLHDTEDTLHDEPVVTPKLPLPELREEQPTYTERASAAVTQSRDYFRAAYAKASAPAKGYEPLMKDGKPRPRTVSSRLREFSRERWIYPLLITLAYVILLSTLVFDSAWITSSSESEIEVDFSIWHASLVTPENEPFRLDYDELCDADSNNNNSDDEDDVDNIDPSVSGSCQLLHARKLMIATIVFASCTTLLMTFLFYFSHTVAHANVIQFETMSQYALAALLGLTGILNVSTFFIYLSLDLSSFFREAHVNLHYAFSLYLSFCASALYLAACGLMLTKPVVTFSHTEGGFDFGEQGYEVASTPKMPHPHEALMIHGGSNVL